MLLTGGGGGGGASLGTATRRAASRDDGSLGVRIHRVPRPGADPSPGGNM